MSKWKCKYCQYRGEFTNERTHVREYHADKYDEWNSAKQKQLVNEQISKEHLLHDPDEFYKLILILGGVRNGKTLLGIREIVSSLVERPNLVVVTNIDLQLDSLSNYSKYESEVRKLMPETDGVLISDQMETMKNIEDASRALCVNPWRIIIAPPENFTQEYLTQLLQSLPSDTEFLLVLDEAYMSGEARRAMQSEVIDFSHLVEQRGHFKARILLISPQWGEFDTRFRTSADFIVESQKFDWKLSEDLVSHSGVIIKSLQSFKVTTAKMNYGRVIGSHSQITDGFIARCYFPAYNTHTLKNIVRTSENDDASEKNQHERLVFASRKSAGGFMERSEIIRRAMSEYGAGMTPRKISQETGIPEHVVRDDLNRMLESKLVYFDGKYWRLPVSVETVVGNS